MPDEQKESDITACVGLRVGHIEFFILGSILTHWSLCCFLSTPQRVRHMQVLNHRQWEIWNFFPVPHPMSLCLLLCLESGQVWKVKCAMTSRPTGSSLDDWL